MLPCSWGRLKAGYYAAQTAGWAASRWPPALTALSWGFRWHRGEQYFIAPSYCWDSGALIFWRDCGRAFSRWAFFLAVLGLAVDLYLAHTMIFSVRAVCWLCIATYLINAAIITILVKKVWQEPKPRVVFKRHIPRGKRCSGN